ncbi:MAG TPA: hypothetical protein VN372_00845 [Methanospirillum sp.]|nr:hypothetical protein [Methanospirillum sp.]
MTRYLLLVLLFSLLSSGWMEPARSEDDQNLSIQLVFASGIFSGGPCHRDNAAGCDLCTGMLDPASGRVSGVTSLDISPGAQWFPSVSPDGTEVVYESKSGKVSTIILISPDTMKRTILADGLRFPAFQDATTVIASSVDEILNQIDLKSLQTEHIQSDIQISDPFPSAGIIAFHTRTDPAGQAQLGILNASTGTIRLFSCKGCGHPSITPDGTRIISVLPDERPPIMSTKDEATSTWSEFSPILTGLVQKIRKLDPELTAAEMIILSYPSFGNDHLLFLTAQMAERRPEGVITIGSRIVQVTLPQGEKWDDPRMQPDTRLLTYLLPDGTMMNCDSATSASPIPGPIQGNTSYSADREHKEQPENTSLPENQITLKNISPGPLTPLSDRLPLYMTVIVRNKDPDYPGSADYAHNLSAYREFRSGIIRISQYLEERGIPWSYQTDWNFLEGTITWEIDDPHPDLLADTDGVNVIAYLSHHGAEIDPYSHETYGYTYPDIAELIRRTGVEPEPVIGGHIQDPADPHYQNWSQYIAGAAGKKFPDSSWNASIITGAATYLHKDEPLVSGIWRPKSPEEYFIDDPNGSMIAMGSFEGDPGSVHWLLSAIGDGYLPNGIWTASVLVNSFALSNNEYFQRLTRDLLGRYERYAQEGRLKFIYVRDISSILNQEGEGRGTVLVIAGDQVDGRVKSGPGIIP